jgi:plasmid maintenance system antidote protein VapI
VTPARINDIVRERKGITADTALRLADGCPLMVEPAGGI